MKRTMRSVQKGFTLIELMIVVAIVSAFIGTLIGKYFLKKVSIEFIRFVVAWMLGSVSFLLILGVL